MRIGLGSTLTVNATERWFTELRAGRCFGFGYRLTPNPGTYGHAQVYNPAASGKRVILRQLLLGIAGNDQTQMGLTAAALANDVGTGVNLLSGSPVGVAHFRAESAAAPIAHNQIGYFHGAASEVVQAWPEWGVELPEGQGLNIHPAAVDTVMYLSVFWMEL